MLPRCRHALLVAPLLAAASCRLFVTPPCTVGDDCPAGLVCSDGFCGAVVPVDAGVAVDAGALADDGGLVADAGDEHLDGGADVDADAAGATIDGGTLVVDAGGLVIDAGGLVVDAGGATADAGADAGDPDADAGSFFDAGVFFFDAGACVDGDVVYDAFGGGPSGNWSAVSDGTIGIAQGSGALELSFPTFADGPTETYLAAGIGDAHGRRVTIRLLEAPTTSGNGAFFTFAVLGWDGAGPELSIAGGQLTFDNGGTSTSVVYFSSVHQWLRIELDATSITALTSTNGLTWSALRTFTAPSSMSDATLWIGAGVDVTSASNAGRARVDFVELGATGAPDCP